MERLAKLLPALVLTLSLGLAVEAGSPQPVPCTPTAIGTVYGTGLTYVANGSRSSVSVIRGSERIGAIPVGPHPRLIGITQKTEYVNVVHRDDRIDYPPGYGLTIIRGTQVLLYRPHFVSSPTSIALWNTDVLVADSMYNFVRILDSWWEESLFFTDAYPIDIAVDPKADAVYVANRDSDTVTFVDYRHDTESIPVGHRPLDVETDPERGFAYVANASGNSVSIIHGGEVIGTAPAESPGAIAINPHTGYVYVVATDSPNRRVTILRAGGWPLGTTTLDFHPEAIKADPATGDIYVAGWETLSYEEQDAYVAVLRNMDVVITIPIRLQTRREYAPALNISIDPTGGYAYVSEYNSGTVTVLHNAELLDTISACSTTAYLPLVVRH